MTSLNGLEDFDVKNFFIVLTIWVSLTVSLMSCGTSTQDMHRDSIEDIGTVLSEDITGDITVYYFEDSPYRAFLLDAARQFENEHPGTKIIIEGFSKMPEIKTIEIDGVIFATSSTDDTQERADYIMRVNTELMGGKGPDILAADILPFYKYAESGYIEDLMLYMEADDDFKETDYRSKIFEETRYKSGQYMIPLNVGFSFISFDKTKLDSAAISAIREKGEFTYWEFTNLIHDQFMKDSSYARVIDLQGGPRTVFNVLFEMEYKKYVDLENKKANFIDSDFAQLLDRIEQQHSNGYFAPSFESPEESMQDFIEGQRLYYYKYQYDLHLQGIFRPRQATDLPEAFPTTDIDEIAGPMIDSEGNTPFNCNHAYGINSNSRNKKLAWEFLKFLLSEQMQQNLSLGGLPVNNAAFTKTQEIFFATGLSSDGSRMEIVEEEYLNAYNDYMEFLDSFLNRPSFFPETDKTIKEMIKKEVILFFEGSKSAEDVTNALQNSVQLYLSE